MGFKLAVGCVALQVLFFIGWAGYEQSRFRVGHGQSILVHVRPVDPRDYLRGQYFQLGFDFSSPASFPEPTTNLETGADVWVVLAPGQDADLGFHVPVRASATRPDVGPDEVVLRGHVDRWRFLFGVESYYVPEGTETPRIEDLTVRLRVGEDDLARIDTVYLNGQPWP